jgi:hypothetical protein
VTTSHVLYIPLVFLAGLVVGLWLARVARRKDED